MVGTAGLVPSSLSAHVIPTVTHTIIITPKELHTDVKVTYFYDPIIINRFIRDFDPNMDGKVDESEVRKWRETYLNRVSIKINDTRIPIEKMRLRIPEIDGLMNEGEPVEFNGTLPVQFNCNESKKVQIIDSNIFMSIDDDVFTFVVDKKGCISVTTLKSPRNEAVAYIGKELSESEKKAGILATESTKETPANTTSNQTGDITKILRDKNTDSRLLLWALLISFILGGLHALTPGHGKTLVAAYLVGQHGTKKDALILSMVTTITHTSSIYILGFISIFAARYFLPEKIIPALETISALSIFGLGIWLFTKRWDELKIGRLNDDSPHTHGTGIGKHSHSINGNRLGVKSLVSLGFSGGIVPCADALAIMIIAIGLNKTVLGMILIVFFSLGLAAVLVVLGILMVTSRSLFDRFTPSARIAGYFPIISASVIIAVGALLVLKTVKVL
ncbi:MAG: hypothetical protein M3Q44_06350 [bacterium]|nr:hypothetical protein [bacterium]